MDDRKKLIAELEQRKREQAGLLDTLLIRLGEAILARAIDSNAGEDDSAFGELTAFRRLLGDIADSEAAIQAVEEQIRRFKGLEENIEAREQEEANYTKELAVMHGRLGRLLLDACAGISAGGSGFADFCAPYREDGEALLSKVVSLEERLSGLEQKERGNVLTWIGKNAQGFVLRSFLTKAQDNLEQLRRTVGERYTSRDNYALPGGEGNGDRIIPEAVEIESSCVDISEKKAALKALSQDLVELREERAAISVSYNAEGGPHKRIQVLKNNIVHIREELKTLYRRIGADAASVDIDSISEITPDRRQIIDSLVTPEDREIQENAARISRLIQEDEIAIEKLQIALAIDEERVKIEKYRRLIQSKKERIAQAERNIVEYERAINDSEATIQKLQDKSI